MGLFSKGSSGKQVNNWYEDRYQSIILQRNFLALATLLSLLGIMFSVFAVRAVTLSKTIDPFVIEVESKTGIPTVVTPVSGKVYTQDAAVVRYFLVQYVKARESFNPFAYRYFYYNVVPLLSSGVVGDAFRGSISSPDSPIKYADNPRYIRDVLISNISELPKTGEFPTYRIEFVIRETEPSGLIKDSNKVATISYNFIDNLSLSDEDRYVNPLGFQVQYYVVTDRVLN